MIFGLRSKFPCAAKFNGRLLFWKIFRGNGSKIAGSKLQLVLFDTFLYNKLIPVNTFLILPQNWPKQHLPTCPPTHLKHQKPMSALMFCVKTPIFRLKYNFFNFGCCTPICTPLGCGVQLNALWDQAWGYKAAINKKNREKHFLRKSTK